MRPHTRRIMVRESPGREPTPWVLQLDDEGLSLRRLRRRERYTITHSRLLALAVRDSAGALIHPSKEQNP